MQKYSKFHVLISAVVFYLVMVANVFALPIAIEIQPTYQVVSEGSIVNVGVFLNNDSNHIVKGIDLRLDFNPTILDYIGYSVGPTLSSHFFMDNLSEISHGKFLFTEIDLAGFNPLLISMQFNSLAEGVSALNLLSDTYAYDINGAIISDLVLISGAVQVVQPVPEPSTIMLLCFGLIGFGVIMRKKSICTYKIVN